MKRYNVVFLIFIFGCISCNEISDDKTENIIFNDLIVDDFYTSNIIKSIELIPLKTKNGIFIGDNPNLKITNDKIYVFESKTGTLFTYSLNGELLNTFKKVGRGPGEYTRGEDFIIDEEKGTIEILSLIDRKVYIYYENGEFHKSINTKASAYSFAKDRKGDYWLTRGFYNFGNDSIGNYKIYCINDSSKIIKKQLPDSCALSMPLTETNFTSYNNKLLFRIFFDNNVYQIFNGEISKIFTFDFGRYAFPKNVLQTTKKNIYKSLTSRTNMFIGKVLENADYMYFFLTKEGLENSQYHLIFSKEKKQYTLLEKQMKSEMDYGLGSANLITDNNELVFITDPITAKEFLEKRREKELLKDAGFFSEDANHLVIKIQLQ